MISSMRDLERTWNKKFNYPWTFFNDVPFTEEFKTRTSKETKAKCNYGKSLILDLARSRFGSDFAGRGDSKRTLGGA